MSKRTTNIEIEDYDRIENEIEGELENRGEIEIDLKKTGIKLKALRNFFFGKPVTIQIVERQKNRAVKVVIKKEEIRVEVSDLPAEIKDALPEIEKQRKENARYFAEGKVKEAEFISSIDYKWSEKQYANYCQIYTLDQLWERADSLIIRAVENVDRERRKQLTEKAEKAVREGEQLVSRLEEMQEELKKAEIEINLLKLEFQQMKLQTSVLKEEMNISFRLKTLDLVKNGSLGYVQTLGKQQIEKEKEEEGLLKKVINNTVTIMRKIFRL